MPAIAGRRPLCLRRSSPSGGWRNFPPAALRALVAEYQKVKPGVQIDYQGIGSGGGIKGITDKTIDFAGSDAPMSKKELAGRRRRGEHRRSPVVCRRRRPGLQPAGRRPGRELHRRILAEIYWARSTTGTIRRSRKLNPDVKLPDLADHAGLADRRERHQLRLHQLSGDAEQRIQADRSASASR